VVGDAFRIRQVLTNLIGNAIKFTERGQVVVTVAPDPKFHMPGAMRFTVTDSGIGIPREKLKMIFEPFTQADSSSARGYGGSGLGLAIATRLVGLMHGALAADSEVGRGSTFSFTVPFETVTEAAAKEASLRGISAIVIDDNAEARGGAV
jgi:two-component system, sensor histidine kinase and response regulator